MTDSGNNDLVLKVGIVGPTRVGKTSLIASVLANAQEHLQGTPVTMRAEGLGRKKLAKFERELEGSLLAGRFNPGALGGTADMERFDLTLDSGVEGEAIQLAFLDYPGGWLDEVARGAEQDANWKVCQEWIRDSTVLIVPVEAAVLMEAVQPEHIRSLPSILTTVDVKNVVSEWAKERALRTREPGVLLFCPVKCESYFTDNGGLSRDRSEELRQKVERVYAGVLEVVRGDAHHVKVVYAPIDTIGCVEIKKDQWVKLDEEKWEFSAEYRVRKPGMRRVFGARIILKTICEHFVVGRRAIKAKEAEALDALARKSTELSERDEGFFWNIWNWVTGEQARRETLARDTSDEAKRSRDRIAEFDAVIAALAEEAPGPRVRSL